MVSTYLKDQIGSIEKLHSFTEHKKKWVLNYWMHENNMLPFGFNGTTGEFVPEATLIPDFLPLSRYQDKWDLMFQEVVDVFAD